MSSIKALFLISLLAIQLPLMAAQSSLQEKLAALAAEARGHVGVGVAIVETSETVYLHGNDHFPMQSVYKFPIAMATLALADAGKINLDDMIQVGKSDYVTTAQHSPIRDKYPDVGLKMSGRELLEYMVSESDGSACDVLLRTIGGPGQVMKFLGGAGVTGIEVLSTEKEIGADNAVQYRNYATPQGAIQLLRLFHEGKLLKPASNALLRKFMTETPTGLKRIKGLLPEGTVVVHKTGSSRTVDGVGAATNDMGIVTLPDGNHLLIAVFIKDSRVEYEAREHVIARIAKLVWDTYAAPSKAP